jgi:hypothetical protein
MSDIEKPLAPSDDLLWGAQQIADFLGVSTDRVYYLIKTQRLPIGKLGRKTVVASRRKLQRALADALAQPPSRRISPGVEDRNATGARGGGGHQACQEVARRQITETEKMSIYTNGASGSNGPVRILPTKISGQNLAKARRTKQQRIAIAESLAAGRYESREAYVTASGNFDPRFGD